MTIRHKLGLAFLLVALLPAFLITAPVLMTVRELARDEFQESSSRENRQMHNSPDSSQETRESVEAARASDALIRASVQEVRDMTAQIATAAQQQTQVAEDIGQIHVDARLVAQLSDRARANSQSLASVSGDLHEWTNHFKT